MLSEYSWTRFLCQMLLLIILVQGSHYLLFASASFFSLCVCLCVSDSEQVHIAIMIGLHCICKSSLKTLVVNMLKFVIQSQIFRYIENSFHFILVVMKYNLENDGMYELSYFKPISWHTISV